VSVASGRKILRRFFADKERLVVLTGAGISSGSGIPTYRSLAGNWQAGTPIKHQDFLAKRSSRKRYWRRSYAGWPAINRAKPSPAHYGLKQLEEAEKLSLIVTQNVDRLHQLAGSRIVLDLHGRLDQVICLGCPRIYQRSYIQRLLKSENPFLKESGQTNPDGDAHIDSYRSLDIKTPICESCQSDLKPNVTFFGDSVNRDLVNSVYEKINESDGFVAIGTSLKVFSGYRFLRHAAEKRIPIAVINAGSSRGQNLSNLYLRYKADDLFENLI